MVRASTIVVLLLAACGDDTASRDALDATATTEEDVVVDATADLGDVADTADVEILFVGYPCAEDELCSTGYCYGKATLQGHFEDAECQEKCLPTFDFDHYCNTDADCCKGTCCVGCPGGQNGLCVLSP